MQPSETQGNPAPREAALFFAWRQDGTALLLLALLLAAMFLPVHLQGRSTCALPLEHDVGFQWIPFKEFQARSLEQGFFPLWTDHLFAGMPFLAFSHTGALYPLGLILVAWDYARAVNLFYPLHLFIAGAGLYLLFLRLGNSRLAAWLAAASVIFTGHFFYFIHFLPSTCTIAWSPWLLLALTELARNGKARWLFWLIAGLALQVLGGDVESTIYGLGFSFVFLLVLRWRDPEFAALRPVPVLLGLILGLILALAQFLPLFEYSHHFIRAHGVTFDYYRQRVLPVELAWALLWPFNKVRGLAPTLLDAPYLYLGLLPLFFAPLAVLRRARPTSRPLALLALAALAYAFGSLKALDWLLYHLPLLGKFGATEHAFYLFQIFLGLLAGQGIHYFLSRDPRARRAILLLFVALALVLFGIGYLRVILFPEIYLVLIALALVLLLAVFSPRRRFSAGLALALIFALDTYAWAYRYLPRNDPKIFQAPLWIKSLIADRSSRYQFVTRLGLNDPVLLHHLGFRLDFDTLDGWITVPPLRFAELINRVDPRAASFDNGKLAHLGLNVDLRDGKFLDAKSLPLLDLLNLSYILDRRLPLKFASPAFLAYADPERQLKPPRGPQRSESEPSSSRNLWLQAPELVSYRLYLEREDRLHLQLKAKQAQGLIFLDQSGRTSLLFARRGDSKKITIGLAPWAAREAIFSFASIAPPMTHEALSWEEPAIVNPKLPLQEAVSSVDQEDRNQFTIYRNSEALPRAFIAHEVEVIPEDAKLLDRLAAMPRDHLRQTLLLAKASPGTDTLQRLTGSAFGQPPSPVVQLENFPDRQSFHLLAVRPGYLFTSEQYLPGWRAWVDGKEWRVEQADYCFRAVFLDGGEHRVTFSYQPLSFRVGLWASLASLLLFGIIAAGRAFAPRS